MRYALLINERPGADDGLDARQRSAVSAEYDALRADDRVVGGAHLGPAADATTVRTADGELLLTDGPFADTKEVFGGFYLVEVPDRAAAVELARRIPALRTGGSVEIRPVDRL